MIGAHVSITNGINNAANIIKKAKGNILQVYFPDKYQLSDTDIKEFHNMDIKVVVHSSYKINMAKNWNLYSWHYNKLLEEAIRAEKIKAIGLVVHFGKKLDLDQSVAYNNMFTMILEIIKKTNILIILETTAGQGTEMCYKLEDLTHFYKKFNNKIRKRVKICIDTCHIFQAGYDIKSEKKAKLYIDTFNELIGLEYVALIHLNDSYHGLGARIDRHASIGNGTIGIIGLIEFYKTFKNKCPIVLETPDININKSINLLQSFDN